MFFLGQGQRRKIMSWQNGENGVSARQQPVVTKALEEELDLALLQNLEGWSAPRMKPSGIFKSRDAYLCAPKLFAAQPPGKSSPGTAVLQIAPVLKGKATVTVMMIVMETWPVARTTAHTDSLPGWENTRQIVVNRQLVWALTSSTTTTAMANASRAKGTVTQTMTAWRGCCVTLTIGLQKIFALQVDYNYDMF